MNIYYSVPKSLNTARYLNWTMRLQKQLSRKYEGKEYAKYVIVVNPKIIEKLGWKDREKLEAEIRGEKLVVEKKG